MRLIKQIIIHCSATPNGRWLTVSDIDAYHKDSGFHRNENLIGYNQPLLKHIGYHFVIYTNGAVSIGRGLNEPAEKTLDHTHLSISICLVGSDRYSPDQWQVLKKLCNGLRDQFHTIHSIIGHNEVDTHKTCPGFNVQAWRGNSMEPLPGHLVEVV